MFIKHRQHGKISVLPPFCSRRFDLRLSPTQINRRFLEEVELQILVEMFGHQRVTRLYFLLLMAQCGVQSTAKSKGSTGIQSLSSTNNSMSLWNSGHWDYRSTFSHHGYNSGTYENFRFNKLFNKTRALVDDTDNISSYYSWFVRYLCNKAEAGDMSYKVEEYWKPIAFALRESYRYERGAVIYNNRTGKWMYCGWIIIPYSFYPRWGPLKICAGLTASGLPEIQRAPVPFEDYIPEDAVTELREHAIQVLKNTDERVVTREVNEKYKNDLSGGLYIDLFQLATDSYEKRCLARQDTDPLWKATCCYSTYLGSPFCVRAPYNVL